jgi:hypothetical protein
MKITRKVSNNIAVPAAVLALAVATLAPPAAHAAEQELAPETHDGLTLVPDSKVAAGYIDSAADFSVYKKVMILDCHVAFKKNWQRDQRSGSASKIRVTAGDMDRIKAEVAGLFRDVFEEELSKDGGYEIVYSAGDDVLLVRPAIIDLDVTAPDTMSAGRSRTYTTSSGAATLFIELYDSVTGDILARAADRKAANRMGGHLGYSNRVTNKSDARKMMRGWAELLRGKLDEFHGK